MKRKYILIVSVILLLITTIGVTTAFVNRSTGTMKNTFSAASDPQIEVLEEFNDVTKTNVKVKVTKSDGAVFVRVNLVFNLIDDAGNILAKSPEINDDYKLDLGTDWVCSNDGFYYYKKMVKSGASTTNLINSCVSLNKDYKLSLDVMAQAIQATPEDAIKDAWGEDALIAVTGNSTGGGN